MKLKNVDISFSSKTKEEIINEFGTNPENGLSEKEISIRLKKYGNNVFAKRKRFESLLEFFKSFANPLILLLIIASLISLSLKQTQDFVLILGIIAVSGVVSFVQKFKAEHEAEKLKQKVILTATVLRDGKQKEIVFSHIALGDIIILSVGDIVPADCRIIYAKDLSIDESSLTGESFPIIKTDEIVKENKVLSDQKNIAFAQTHIISGEGKAVVIAVGQNTQFGMLSKETVITKPQTAFDKDLGSFGLLIMKATLVLTIFVFLTNAFFKHDIFNSFLFALALAVGLTPELLPVILTINLARGAVKMSKKEVVVKYLPAIQNLGGMNILCTDKTGTLTENTIILKSTEDIKQKENKKILELGIVNSLLHSGFKNPLDQALLSNVKKSDYAEWKRVDDIPYDFDRKIMSVIVRHKDSSKLLMITKGAPHKLIDLVQKYQSGGKDYKLTNEIKEKIQKRYESLSNDGYRTIAICTKELTPQKKYDIKDEKDLTFVGFLSFFDPPKKDVRKTFDLIEELGISIKILTGDNELVTKKVCEETDIPVSDVLLGSDIDSLSQVDLKKKVLRTTIFARLNPEQKAKMIEVLKSENNVVGYLGDGVNDAPPLKMADVGISVNNGSDIARDIADIILMKKSLIVLKDGVLEGRKTYGNILKYIMMETSSNFGNMITVAIASLLLPFLPMLPIQILLNNFLYDVSQLAIASDNVDKEFVSKPRKWQTGFIKNFMLIFGPISSLFDFMTFFVLFYVLHASVRLFQTGWFVESLITQTLIVFAIRTKKIPFFRSKPSKILIISSFVICLIGILITNTFTSSYFSFMKLPYIFYIMLLGIIVLYFTVVEITKVWFYKRS